MREREVEVTNGPEVKPGDKIKLENGSEATVKKLHPPTADTWASVTQIYCNNAIESFYIASDSNYTLISSPGSAAGGFAQTEKTNTQGTVPDDHPAHSKIGAGVRKLFDKGWCNGQVDHIRTTDSGTVLYHVIYPDGDAEEMDDKELETAESEFAHPVLEPPWARSVQVRPPLVLNAPPLRSYATTSPINKGGLRARSLKGGCVGWWEFFSNPRMPAPWSLVTEIGIPLRLLLNGVDWPYQ